MNPIYISLNSTSVPFYKYNMTVNQVDILQVVLIKLSSKKQPVKLILATWFTVNKQDLLLVGKGLNRVDKRDVNVISKWSVTRQQQALNG